MLQPRYTANGDFAFQKILSDGEFVAAGYVEIPVGKAKPRKSTKDNTYVRIPSSPHELFSSTGRSSMSLKAQS